MLMPFAPPGILSSFMGLFNPFGGMGGGPGAAGGPANMFFPGSGSNGNQQQAGGQGKK